MPYLRRWTLPFAALAGVMLAALPPAARAAAPIGMVEYGDGYLMVASDGGIFDFSSKPFLGSLGSLRMSSPVVGVAALPA